MDSDASRMGDRGAPDDCDSDSDVAGRERSAAMRFFLHTRADIRSHRDDKRRALEVLPFR
jgi:hypothetical protein